MFVCCSSFPTVPLLLFLLLYPCLLPLFSERLWPPHSHSDSFRGATRAIMHASPWIIFLLLCFLICAGAKRQNGQEKRIKPHQPLPTSQPAKKPRSRSVLSSGEFTTKEGHSCTWQTSGEGLVSLMVNCSIEATGNEARYWCRYVGKPDLCQAYGVKSSQYWKQLVGKLKKRMNACEGEKFLKAKTCKKAPVEAHMKLAQRNGEEEKKRGKEGGKKKGTAGVKSSDGEKAEKRQKKEKNEEEEKKKREERTEAEEEKMMSDMQPVQTYCSEGWHSVCSFFVKFFEG
uniref:Fibroblast growth factor binding protein 3 n=1 Tax=Oryzias sinensis TaxID=183150 RepID=A0A8C7YV18_9TELE